MELLMKTVHGSHLYAPSHAGLDRYTFEVWLGRRTRQTISGGDDVLRVSWDDFQNGVSKGVPQFLEALYSPYKAVDRLPTVVPGYWSTVRTYQRTIKSFWRDDPSEFKLRRHSARWAWNLQEFMECGRFNPVLGPDAREWCEQYAIGAVNHWRL